MPHIYCHLVLNIAYQCKFRVAYYQSRKTWGGILANLMVPIASQSTILLRISQMDDRSVTIVS
jgi:hypothetical protein